MQCFLSRTVEAYSLQDIQHGPTTMENKQVLRDPNASQWLSEGKGDL